MSSRRPDVVIYCQDGHDRRLVQRLRWMAQQGRWRAMLRSPTFERSATQWLTEHDEEFASQRVEDVSAAAPAVRTREPLRCTCGLTVPIRDGRLQFFCDRVAPETGHDVSLVLLRGWLDRAPSWQAYPEAF